MHTGKALAAKDNSTDIVYHSIRFCCGKFQEMSSLIRWLYQLTLFVLCFCGIKSYRSPTASLEGSSDGYGYFDKPYAVESHPQRRDGWKLARSSVRMLGYGSLVYVGYSFARKLLQQSPSIHELRPSVQHHHMNETAQAIADVKSDVAELWSAILNIHNKQKELGDKLEKIDSTTTNKLEKMQRDLSSIQSIEDAMEELRDQLDLWKETVSGLQSDIASRSESSSFDEAVSSLTNKMELLSQRIQFAELNAKKMEETLLRRMKQFFVACKDMILGTVQEEDQDEEADNPSS